MQPYRVFGAGRVSHNEPVEFSFNGKRLEGMAGDTLASALLANGVHLVGRSFKYHRPRGIMTAGSEEPNALVQLEQGAYTQPNMRATQVELYPGLTASSQNCWPNVHFDVGAINSVLSRVLPAGFYYKTFMWPASYWMKYEHFIRRAAGLGRAPAAPDPDRYDKRHAHCDVLVVGAGPAGIAAAIAAGRTGARVILADEQAEFGGALLSSDEVVDDESAQVWKTAAIAELASMPDVKLLPRCTVTAYFDHNYLTMVERVTDHLALGAHPRLPRQRLWKVRAQQVVLATGAHERPLVFSHNDRPGIMLASAARTYLNRYAVRAGDRAVVCTNNDSAYAAALDLSDSGVDVTLVDSRAQTPEALSAALRQRDVEVLGGHAVVSSSGRHRVKAAHVAPLDQNATVAMEAGRKIDCDLICMSGGWNPAVHLLSQSKGKLGYDDARACLVPSISVQAQRSAGAANGVFDLADCLSEGSEAGRAAAADAGFTANARVPAPSAPTVQATPTQPLWLVPSTGDRPPVKHFVDFQNDVTAADLELAVREGYRSVEHLKRYTTTGMGTDQGKTSNVNALAILSKTLGADIPAVGTTTFRPPYTPITFGALAGRDLGPLMDPERLTPMHDWHVAQGALFEDVGQWKRPWYFPRAGETMQDSVNRECLAAREHVVVLDASTLGKIDIQGPDSAELLNRIYTNDWLKLPIGRCRYGLMCGEDGMVFDDGVTTRLGETHYLMSTTSGNAARVLAWLEEWLQTEWPELDVWCNSVTEQWATASVSGPKARELLQRVCDDIDLDGQAFPFMSLRAGTVAGVPARVMRVSFTGELSYEINVPAAYGLALWTALFEAGADFGITPIGTETMHVLRAEKGFIIAGQDTDGTVTPIDLGLGSMVSKRKDFIGKRSLSRADTALTHRKQLVGLLTDDGQIQIPEGAQVVDVLKPQPPMDMIGHVSSSYYSANLGHSIAMALVRGGHVMEGRTVYVPLEDKVITVRVTSPVFFDPDGERMRG